MKIGHLIWIKQLRLLQAEGTSSGALRHLLHLRWRSDNNQTLVPSPTKLEKVPDRADEVPSLSRPLVPGNRRTLQGCRHQFVKTKGIAQDCEEAQFLPAHQQI